MTYKLVYNEAYNEDSVPHDRSTHWIGICSIMKLSNRSAIVTADPT